MEGRLFLQRIRIGAFGRYVDKVIGPFAPGLNVVYGPNEAGKTTARALVGGVLFGWPEARGANNPYKPASGGRDGSLLFFDEESGRVSELRRAKNSEGVLGDERARRAVLSDIDKETFFTLFSLDADELRGLDAAPDIAARLLTAGSGTEESPAAALAQLDARIARFTSRAASAAESFPNLSSEADDCKARLARARADADSLKAEDAEYHELSAGREALLDELAQANARIEALAAAKGEFARLDARRRELLDERRAATDALAANRERAVAERARIAGVPQVDEDRENRLAAVAREQAAEESRIERRVDAAREAYEQARGAWEAENAAHGTRGASARGGFSANGGASRARAVAAVAALLLAAAGALCVAYGAVLPVFPLVVIGVFLIAAAVLVGVLASRERGRSRPGDGEARLAGLRSSMARAKSTLDAREGELLLARDEARAALVQAGLSDPPASPADAVRLVADMREARLSREALDAREQAAAARLARANAELTSIAEQRAAVCRRAGLDSEADEDPTVAAAAIERESLELASRRELLTDRLQQANARFGRLAEALSRGASDADLDQLKIERAQIACRTAEAAEEFAALLLARRLLAEAVRAWGSESQPEVYARASRLMEIMSGGAWTGVRAAGEAGGAIGRGGGAAGDAGVVAVDAIGRAFDPKLLSTGTRQQLYLALRIALLQSVPGVGASCPVLADDILVNFDDDRREGAARALAQLATTRQVIAFTCHREVVSSFERAAPGVNVLAL